MSIAVTMVCGWCCGWVTNQVPKNATTIIATYLEQGCVVLGHVSNQAISGGHGRHQGPWDSTIWQHKPPQQVKIMGSWGV